LWRLPSKSFPLMKSSFFSSQPQNHGYSTLERFGSLPRSLSPASVAGYLNTWQQCSPLPRRMPGRSRSASFCLERWRGGWRGGNKKEVRFPATSRNTNHDYYNHDLHLVSASGRFSGALTGNRREIECTHGADNEQPGRECESHHPTAQLASHASRRPLTPIAQGLPVGSNLKPANEGTLEQTFPRHQEVSVCR